MPVCSEMITLHIALYMGGHFVSGYPYRDRNLSKQGHPPIYPCLIITVEGPCNIHKGS